LQKSITALKLPHHALALLVILGLVLAVHGPAVVANFGRLHWEDELFFAHQAEQIHTWRDCLTRPLWPGLYRPLTTTCYYYAVGALAGPEPGPRVQVHHLINLGMYILNGWLLFRLGRRFLHWGWAVVAAALFVSRRAHVEVVLNTVEFQALAAVAFVLLAIDGFIAARRRSDRGRLLLACGWLTLALLSKEMAVVTPLILLIYGWLFDRRAAWRWYIAPIGIVALWGLLFVTVFRTLTDNQPTGFGYTLVPSVVLTNYSAHFLSFANPLAYAPGELIMPPMLREAATHGALQVSLVTLLLATLLLVSWRTGGETARLAGWGLGLGFFVLAVAPFALLEDRLFLRYGYFGHAGLALGVTALLQSAVAAVWQAQLARRLRNLRLGRPHQWLPGREG
jgi:hypothetical protein